MDVVELQIYVLNVRKSFQNNDEELLIRSIRDFFNSLKERNLIIDQNIKTVAELSRINGVMAAKGCGAMGADTIVVIFDRRKNQSVLQRIHQIILNYSDQQR
jgi:mevalonate kinase